MSKINCVAIVLLALSVLSFQKKDDDNRIYWNKNYQLSWEDFKGSSKIYSPGGAAAYTGVTQSYECKNGLLEIDVMSYLVKNKSWVKEDDRTTSTLKHEQGHFDIAEIFARKFRKVLSECKFKKSSLKEKITNTYNLINKELGVYQNTYDKETTNPRNEVKQSEWNEKIAKQLQELEQYSETHLSIKVK